MTTSTLPRKLYDLNRSIAGSAVDATVSAAQVARNVLDASRTAGRTVCGQTRSAVERTMGVATGGLHEVQGQTRAQGRRIADTADSEVNRLVDRAQHVVDGTPSAGTPYEQWTREQLYERARDLDVEGRSSMNKKQLIKALRQH